MRLKLFLVMQWLIIHTIMGQSENTKLKIEHLTGQFYIYTTYNTYEQNRLPANGMYVVTNEGVILFDTPWDTTQFQTLLDSITVRHNQSVTTCIATHWHSDRTAGLGYYRKLGIKTYTTRLTDSLCVKNNMSRAEFLIDNDTIFKAAPFSFETYYPGQGHTSDNIIIWFDKEKILYGGCLIKAADARNLGYLGDANLKEYYNSLKKVERKCKDPKFIIISHSHWNNLNSLKQSIKLAKKLSKE